ncbi:unnamed protein product [Cylindrotheca closterium]|uniref:Uncharacterized protein n=1 Tax=Cylindrotheca closterium TaxID=2856 RepID=A0AAD2CKF7_9STRA|nr:unnamed protein product [Cylindrotheca closterium]
MMTSYHFFGNEGERIPRAVTDLAVHALVQAIPVHACENFNQLTRVNFNGLALRAIGRYAFARCTSLLEIDIPQSVTTIERAAFASCKSLTKVRFHEDGLLTTIRNSAFFQCSSLIEVSIPSSVETIAEFAFECCESLARVFFQEGLKTIDYGAFKECIKLETVDIPRSVVKLGNGAFRECTLLQEVNIEEGCLRVIGERAFSKCVKLKTIRIPSTVERTELATFEDCFSLEEVVIQNGLKYVGDKTFHSCKNLQAVALPQSVDVICSSAFRQCRKLVSVELGDDPSTVTIQSDAFEGCESLVNICLPSEPEIAQRCPDDVGPGVIVSIDSFRGCRALENQYGDANILLALIHRFDNFLIHKKCYHASITTTDELAREIESSMQSPDEGNDHLVDSFGMTPFHVLLSAANCRPDLLQVLQDAYPPHVLGWKDVLNGKTAIEYFTARSYHLSGGSRTILRMALFRWLVGSISSWNGLETWKSDMSSRVNAIIAEDELEQRQSLVQEASMALSLYERMEATTLLELSLWKMEMKSANKSLGENAVDKGGHEAYRIRSGASVVIPNVISFVV